MHLYNAWLPPPVAEETKREKEAFTGVVNSVKESYNADDPESVYSTLKWVSVIDLLSLSTDFIYVLFFFHMHVEYNSSSICFLFNLHRVPKVANFAWISKIQLFFFLTAFFVFLELFSFIYIGLTVFYDYWNGENIWNRTCLFTYRLDSHSIPILFAKSRKREKVINQKRT